MSEKVSKYIKENWMNTVRQPHDKVNGIVKLPVPFTTPCATKGFTDFYYWDTYFANKGLLHDGFVEQVQNNLDTMKYFIEGIGFVPNANNILDRSQPPLFTAGVYELYQHTGDMAVIERYADAILLEMDFFFYDRMTEIGLNSYQTRMNKVQLLRDRFELCRRTEIPMPETEEEQARLSYNLYSIAESGWDFNPRFHTDDEMFATDEFVHLDLNGILYDAETKGAEMLALIGRAEDSEKLLMRAEKRLELMKRYMLDETTGIYMDYNFERDEFSKVVSAASMYPFAFGISDDKEAAEKVLKKLELEFGLAACEDYPDEHVYQWGYPMMWPSNIYFTVTGLRRIGLEEDARRIATKYVETVERCFEQSGTLWEKYDASKGIVPETNDYETPAMMGWTAGVYQIMTEWLGD